MGSSTLYKLHFVTAMSLLKPFQQHGKCHSLSSCKWDPKQHPENDQVNEILSEFKLWSSWCLALCREGSGRQTGTYL